MLKKSYFNEIIKITDEIGDLLVKKDKYYRQTGMIRLVCQDILKLPDRNYGTLFRRLYFSVYRVKKRAEEQNMSTVIPLIDEIVTILKKISSECPPDPIKLSFPTSDFTIVLNQQKVQNKQVQLNYEGVSIGINSEEALLMSKWLIENIPLYLIKPKIHEYLE